MKQLQYKNSIIPGYFIDENGKIYNSDGIEQEQKNFIQVNASIRIFISKAMKYTK